VGIGQGVKFAEFSVGEVEFRLGHTELSDAVQSGLAHKRVAAG
jgi:hypothetical protein